MSETTAHLAIAGLALALSTAILALALLAQPAMVSSILPVVAGIWTLVLGWYFGMAQGIVQGKAIATAALSAALRQPPPPRG